MPLGGRSGTQCPVARPPTHCPTRQDGVDRAGASPNTAMKLMGTPACRATSTPSSPSPQQLNAAFDGHSSSVSRGRTTRSPPPPSRPTPGSPPSLNPARPATSGTNPSVDKTQLPLNLAATHRGPGFTTPTTDRPPPEAPPHAGAKVPGNAVCARRRGRVKPWCGAGACHRGVGRRGGVQRSASAPPEEASRPTRRPGRSARAAPRAPSDRLRRGPASGGGRTTDEPQDARPAYAKPHGSARPGRAHAGDGARRARWARRISALLKRAFSAGSP